MVLKKSSRHTKISGDFAEALVLYWLSKYGYECVRIDHTGIDLIARDPKSSLVMGISVKGRSRDEGKEKECINLKPDEFKKARTSCQAFNCVPYYAFVVDGASVIRCFVVPLERLEQVVGGPNGGTREWLMSSKAVSEYRKDPLVKSFELETLNCSWRGKID